MRLQIRVESGSRLSWAELFESVPDTYAVEERTAELVFYEVAEPVTGVRLSREDGAHVIALPAFASVRDIQRAVWLVEQIVSLVDGATAMTTQLVRDGYAGEVALPRGVARIEGTDGPCVRHGEPSTIRGGLAMNIAKQLVDACMPVFVDLANGPRDRVFVIEGVHRPHFLGNYVARRVAELEREEGDVLNRLASAMGAFQCIGPPTVLPGLLQVRTPDGETASCVMWDPRRETLTPPFDYLLIRESEITKIRVPRAQVAAALSPPGIGGATLGAPVDDCQWLLGQQEEPDRRRLFEHASTLGKRLRMRDP